MRTCRPASGIDAPDERHRADHRRVRRQPDHPRLGSEPGHRPGGAARLRVQHRIAEAPVSVDACQAAWVDGAGDPVDRRHRRVIVAALHAAQAGRPLAIARLALGALGDAAHRAHHADRVTTDRRLPRQHHGVGAVEHRVGDVADLGPRRRRRGDHRLEHLRRGDHRVPRARRSAARPASAGAGRPRSGSRCRGRHARP